MPLNDNDLLLINDSQDSNEAKKITYGTLKSNITGDQDLQAVTDNGNTTDNLIETSGGVRVTGGGAAAVEKGIGYFDGEGLLLIDNNESIAKVNQTFGVISEGSVKANASYLTKFSGNVNLENTSTVDDFKIYAAGQGAQENGTSTKTTAYYVNSNLTDKAGVTYGFNSGLNVGAAAGNNFNFFAEGDAPNFFLGSTHIGGSWARNTRQLWESTLTEEQKEQLAAGTFAVPANVSLPGDGTFARQWWYDQLNAENKALVDAGTRPYPKHLRAENFTDTFALGDNTNIDFHVGGDGNGWFGDYILTTWDKNDYWSDASVGGILLNAQGFMDMYLADGNNRAFISCISGTTPKFTVDHDGLVRIGTDVSSDVTTGVKLNADGTCDFNGTVTIGGGDTNIKAYGNGQLWCKYDSADVTAITSAFKLQDENGDKFIIQGDGSISLGGSNVSGDPNISLNADGSCEFAENKFRVNPIGNTTWGSDNTFAAAGPGGVYLTPNAGGGCISIYATSQTGSVSETDSFIRCYTAPDESTAKTEVIRFDTNGTIHAVNITDGNTTKTITEVLSYTDVADSVLNLVTRLDALEANEIIDDAVDTSLLSLLASASARLDSIEARLSALEGGA